jgi:hypothetical protein
VLLGRRCSRACIAARFDVVEGYDYERSVGGSMALPADQASEIARLRRELDRRGWSATYQKSRRHLCGDAAVQFAFIEQHAPI